MFPEPLLDLAGDVLDAARARRWRIATAESCTGGLVAAALTEIPGSSAVVDRGFVTYSNQAKQTLLGVPAHMIADRGAVSEPVARRMAEGALAAASAELAVAVTGVAGPGGGTAQKPVGLVHFATAVQGGLPRNHMETLGDLGRAEIRLAATEVALRLLLQRLEEG
ncbi:MAG: nicotinamide-nucleotide amidohydrolase family protein [Caulobacteraceae bacterium]|nr:nicotinamide-nucleotide amidohydrolase family protein [Caulobacter sp.]